MKKTIIISFAAVILISIGIFALNYFPLQIPMNEVLKSDPRNGGIEVTVRYSNYVDPSILVYDLTNVSASKTPADVFRVLLQFADRIKSERFTQVRLAYQGTIKFTLSGSYFQTIGQEYDTQNPIYTMRTFTENLKTPDGSRAYSSWTGGLIGVLNKQLEDFNDFHKSWYLSK